jgi:hypothetical protein
MQDVIAEVLSVAGYTVAKDTDDSGGHGCSPLWIKQPATSVWDRCQEATSQFSMVSSPGPPIRTSSF